MSFSVARSLSSLSNVTTKLFSVSKRTAAQTVWTGNGLAGVRRVHFYHRGFTRSLWYMCSQPGNVPQNPAAVVRPVNFLKPCGCCAMHTQGKHCNMF